VIIISGLVAALLLGIFLAFNFGIFPSGHTPIETFSDDSKGSEQKPSGNSNSQISEINPLELSLQPLSHFKQNRYWKEFLESEDRVAQLVNYDTKLRKLAGGEEGWIVSPNSSNDHHSFLMGLSLVQRIGRFEETAADSRDSSRFDGDIDRDWKQWFKHLETSALDEFEYRDLVESEKKAKSEILSLFQKGTPYRVSFDILYELNDYDFDRGVYPLKTTLIHKSVFGDLDVRFDEQAAIYIAEADARQLRDEGVTSICMRRVLQFEWLEGWFWLPSSIKGESITLSPIDSQELPSPETWTLSAPGNSMLALRRAGTNTTPDPRIYDSFSNLFRNFHEEYMRFSNAHYEPLTFMAGEGGLSVDEYSRTISTLQSRRDTTELFQLDERLDIVKAQFSLLDAPENLQNLFGRYRTGANLGFRFMMTGNPQAGLKSLQGFLNTHPPMRETYDSIVSEIENLRASSEQQ